MGYLDQISAAVSSVSTDWRERAALLFACGAESGCQPVQNRQGAPAYGPWQIYIPYHPSVDVATANDPQRAAQYMYSHMGVKACVNQQPDWTSDPQGAALRAARCIEHASPLEQYSPQQVEQGWNMVQQYAGAPGGTGTTGTGTPLGIKIPCIPGLPCPGNGTITVPNPVESAAGSAAGAVVGWVRDLLGYFISQDWPQRLLLIGTGWILVLVGVSNLAKLELNSSGGAAAAAAL